MGADQSDDVHEHGEEDERDERDILANPHPARSAPDFAAPDADSALATGSTVALSFQQRVAVVTRPLPAEGVPNCSIRIGNGTATTNNSGNATIDLSGLADGEFDAVVRAPDTSDEEMGPDFRRIRRKSGFGARFRGAC